MNTSQMIITIGSLYILSLFILQTNKNIFFTESTMMNSKFSILAVSIGTSMIEEASSKAFDAATDTNSVTDINLLTAPDGLGPKAGEVYPNFNDFDDFNNYTKLDSSMPSASFKVDCKVMYIEPSNPEVKVNYRTWHKKIVVTVTSKFMPDTVRLSSVYSYWFFR